MTVFLGTTATIEFVAQVCGACGTHFGMPRELYDRALETGEDWYCPRGHCRHFTKSENQKLRDELAREKHRAEQARAWAQDESRRKDVYHRRLNATKGVVTRIKNRVGKGVCPCCNRTFQNLGRHMAGQHPTWAPEDQETA
jgi:hypothetical protein